MLPSFDTIAAMIVPLLFIHLLLFYTHSHFKCCSALLISANLNLSVMHTHDFCDHRKVQDLPSKSFGFWTYLLGKTVQRSALMTQFIPCIRNRRDNFVLLSLR